jgi:hypothetical protein
LIKLCLNETISKVCIGKHLSESFPIQNGLKQGDNIDTIKKNTDTLCDVSKDVGPEINVQKNKYTLLSCHHNVGPKREIKIVNRTFENVSQFKYEYLGTTAINQNLIQEEIKKRLNSGNACCHSV